MVQTKGKTLPSMIPNNQLSLLSTLEPTTWSSRLAVCCAEFSHEALRSAFLLYLASCVFALHLSPPGSQPFPPLSCPLPPGYLQSESPAVAHKPAKTMIPSYISMSSNTPLFCALRLLAESTSTCGLFCFPKVEVIV